MPALEQQSNVSELIDAHTAYLRQMQLQHAKQGIATPPHIFTEIERVEAELAQLKQAAATPVSDDLVEQLGPTGRYQLWMSHIMRLDTDVGRISKRVESLHEKFDQLLMALAVKGATH